MAYKLGSRIINAIGQWLKPVEEIKNTGKAMVGGTVYRFKLLGALINANTPKYDFKKIRQVYRRFGFIRQALAVYKHRATSELPDIACDNVTARNILIERLESMRIFEQLPEMFQDLTVFGNVFYEIIFEEEELPDTKQIAVGEQDGGILVNKDESIRNKARRLKRILGIKRLEPDYMKIVQDEFGRTQYYVNIRDGANPTVLEHWRVIHIKLDSLPGDAFGIGLIEGAIDDIAALRMVEDLQLQLIKHDIYPFRMFSCPTNEVIEEVEAKLAEQERFGDLVVPADVKMDQSKVGNASQDLRALMIFYKEKIFMDLGVPMQMLIEGSKTNKATATVQSDAFNFNVYAFINQVYLPMEKFSRLILLFEGIDSKVTWNYKDIDRGGEQSVRKEIVEWFRFGLIDQEDGIELLDCFGGFRYLPVKTRNKIMKKHKAVAEVATETTPTLDLPGQETPIPELGDKIIDDGKIEKPKRIVDRIKEKVTKPDGTKVEKTTERIKQAAKFREELIFAERLRDEIVKSELDTTEIFSKISNLVNETKYEVSDSQYQDFIDDIEVCIELYESDKDKDQFEYLVSKSCAKFSKDALGD